MPTTDFIEDACDILDKGEHDYVLLALETDGIRVSSSLGPENAKEMLQSLLNGDIVESIKNHLQAFYS